MTSPVRTTALLAIGTILAGPAAIAAIPSVPPPGYTWELQGVFKYTAQDFFSQDVALSQSLAPAGPPSVGSVLGSMAVPTFDPLAEVASLEALDPGVTYGISVLNSIYVVSFNGAASASIANFDASQPSHVYTGGVVLDSWQISNGASASAPPGGLINNSPGVTIPQNTLASFTDPEEQTSGFVNLSTNGDAPADGSTMVFDLSGNVISDLLSDNPEAAFQVASANAQATGNATISATYEVYKLVPEPGVGVLAFLGAVLFLMRRRR